MNWSGSIKVPSVMQYAGKLSRFVGENINKAKEKESSLNNHLFYI
jgi:hypothetical protein